VKKESRIRSSHVNSGTSLSREALTCSGKRGGELRHPKLEVSIERSDTTPYGGIALAARLADSLSLPREIDRHVRVLKRRNPFSASDHVLIHVYNLFLGGTCIEDIGELQRSNPIVRILGAKRLPDPTTAGDFLRRFDEESLVALDRVIDGAQERVWRRLHGGKKQKLAIIDLDSHVRHVYGDQKEGADFTYKGGFGYHPLLLTLSGMQEVLRAVNRPGNVVSSHGVVEQMRAVMPRLAERFERNLWRGDSAFACQPIYDFCEEAGDYFAFVSPAQKNFEQYSLSVKERDWRVFVAKHKLSTGPKRRRGINRRRSKARARRLRDLKLEKQWLAELEYKPARSENFYRLIIRRQRIEEAVQGELFQMWRYRYVITNLPYRYSAEEVVRLTYGRCDQENIIEQLQTGLAGMKMPTGKFLANAAYLTCARLAHNLKCWLAQLVLPQETIRWKWKRFRRALVYVAVRVTCSGRRTLLKIADSHRFSQLFCKAIVRLQT
jgi:hypothetical protein